MKYSFLLFFFSIATIGFSQQNLNPVQWSSEVVDSEDGPVLKITADIEKGWKLYSQFTDPDGPVPTSFEISGNDVEILGDVEEQTEPEKIMSDLFGLEVIQFSEKAEFHQRFKADKGTQINTSVRFMTCDGLRCLPPTTIELQTKI